MLTGEVSTPADAERAQTLVRSRFEEARMPIDNRIQVEARAARLPALLTIATITFILPRIFLIVGGPAVIRVLDLVSSP